MTGVGNRDYLVTFAGVVHDPRCGHVQGARSAATPWLRHLVGDRACTRCLNGVLPSAHKP